MRRNITVAHGGKSEQATDKPSASKREYPHLILQKLLVSRRQVDTHRRGNGDGDKIKATHDAVGLQMPLTKTRGQLERSHQQSCQPCKPMRNNEPPHRKVIREVRM